MGSVELLGIEPLELKFPFELRKQISCSLQLSNKTDDYIAFKVKTTSPKKYCVRPNTGIVLPRSTCDVIVTMQAQREAPLDMQCKDKFLVQSVVASPRATVKDITPEMFTKESGNVVDEAKLRVVYVPPPQPPSPVPEEAEEGSSPRVSVSENGNAATREYSAPREHFEAQENPLEMYLEVKRNAEETPGKIYLSTIIQDDHLFKTTALISRLTEEKNSAIQQNNKLRQEMEHVRREVSKQRGGFSFTFVVFVALLGILLGYLVKK